jgi:hypothetical protein
MDMLRKKLGSERRQVPRLETNGLVAVLDGRTYEVGDISIGGVKLIGLSLPKDQELTITLAERNDPSQAITVPCLVKVAGAGWSSLVFTKSTYAQNKFVVAHIGDLLGVQPYVVK